jgi:hypothetical protein
MKHLVGKTITQKVPFMGDEVEVKKLTVGEILELQKVINASQKGKQDEEKQMKLLRDILRLAVIGADEISDEEFSNFPLGELSELSQQVVSVSGMGTTEGN